MVVQLRCIFPIYHSKLQVEQIKNQPRKNDKATGLRTVKFNQRTTLTIVLAFLQIYEFLPKTFLFIGEQVKIMFIIFIHLRNSGKYIIS